MQRKSPGLNGEVAYEACWPHNVVCIFCRNGLPPSLWEGLHSIALKDVCFKEGLDAAEVTGMLGPS